MNNLLLFLFSLAVTEALLKPVIVFITQRQVRRFLPKVLNRLDPVLPAWIAEYDEAQLREKVVSVIFAVGKELDEEPDVELILNKTVQAYSFLRNAAKLHRD
jgi:hypothetical protein